MKVAIGKVGAGFLKIGESRNKTQACGEHEEEQLDYTVRTSLGDSLADKSGWG